MVPLPTFPEWCQGIEIGHKIQKHTGLQIIIIIIMLYYNENPDVKLDQAVLYITQYFPGAT